MHSRETHFGRTGLFPFQSYSIPYPSKPGTFSEYQFFVILLPGSHSPKLQHTMPRPDSCIAASGLHGHSIEIDCSLSGTACKCFTCEPKRLLFSVNPMLLYWLSPGITIDTCSEAVGLRFGLTIVSRYGSK